MADGTLMLHAQTGYLVSGLARGGSGPDICLSPRNRDNTETLARQYGCRVMPDNQSLVDAADDVILRV